MEEVRHNIVISGADHLTWSRDAEALIERAAGTVLRQEKAPACEVSIFLTDDEGIRELNHRYRQQDAPTDVLSFPMDDAAPLDEAVEQGGPVLLGDIVISLERARVQAAEYGHSPERELAFLVVHGVLHLLGFDHETDAQRRVMRAKEEAALTALGLSREPASGSDGE